MDKEKVLRIIEETKNVNLVVASKYINSDEILELKVSYIVYAIALLSFISWFVFATA